MNPRAPPLPSSRLLDQVRLRIRYIHFNLDTENVNRYWALIFLFWSGRNGANKQMRHPHDIDANGVEAVLTLFAAKRQVSASTHGQALAAIQCLYRAVLAIGLPSAPAKCACLPPVAWHRLLHLSCAKIYA